MKPVQVKMLTPTHIAFEFKIKRERLRELRDEGSFPEPDHFWQIVNTTIKVPSWRPETVAKFLEEHHEEDNRVTNTTVDSKTPRSDSGNNCLLFDNGTLFPSTGPERMTHMGSTCSFCNNPNSSRREGETFCFDCEAVRKMVRENTQSSLGGLRANWRYINDLQEMYDTLIGKSGEGRDEGYVLWMIYRNFNSRAVCIEVFAQQEGGHLYDCMMMTNSEALEFLDNPQWEKLLKNIKSVEEDREFFLEALAEQVKHTH